MVVSFALGGVATLFAMLAYWAIGWWMDDSTDYNRGMWQGGITVAIVLEGQRLARKILNALDDGSTKEPLDRP